MIIDVAPFLLLTGAGYIQEYYLKKATDALRTVKENTKKYKWLLDTSSEAIISVTKDGFIKYLLLSLN